MWITYDHLAELTPDLADKIDPDKREGYLFALTTENNLFAMKEEDLIEHMRVERYELGGGYSLPHEIKGFTRVSSCTDYKL